MSTQDAMSGHGQRPAANVMPLEKDEADSRFNCDGFAVVTSVDLNRNPAGVLRRASERTIVITRHQKTVAYLVSPRQWGELERRIKELEFRLICGQGRTVPGT
jgi:prevent-host-death family protein